MKHTIRRLLLACLLASSASALMATTVPNAMNYQGYLTDDAGVPIGNVTAENRNLEFRLYKQKDGGTPAWGESQIVTVFKGNFSVILGSGTPLGDALTSGEAAFSGLFASAEAVDLYIGIKPVGGDEFSPRQKLLSSAFALHAKTADNIVQAANTQASLSNLVMNGGTQVTGNNIIQFGSGIGSKQEDAGMIGYQKISTDSLDIVGAGTTNTNRKIMLHAEGGVTFTGPITLPSIINRTGHGPFIGSFGESHSFGSQDTTTYARTSGSFGFYLNGSWSPTARSAGSGGTVLAYLENTGFDLRVGKFTGDGSGLTNIGGAGMGVNGANVIEFGKGLTKAVDNGKIGYGTFSSGAALDIVGAGTQGNGSDRKINLHAQGGMRVVGPATVDNAATIGGLLSANAGMNLSGALGMGNSSINFGNRTGQHLNLWSNEYGIGIAGSTTYFRTASNAAFRWYRGGSHADDPVSGTNGVQQMLLDSSGLTVNGGISVSGTFTAGGFLRAPGISLGNGNWSISAGSDLDINLNGSRRAWLLASGGGWSTSSDRNLKKDVETLNDGLGKVMQLRPTRYHFKSQQDDEPLQPGFIAQEVEEVMPELVSQRDGMRGLNYQGLIPVTVAAVQEQQKKIETLNTENESLKKRLEDLEARISKLAEQLPGAASKEAQ